MWAGNALQVIGLALRKQGAGVSTAQGQYVAWGRQCVGFGRFATESALGRARRSTCGAAHLPPFARLRRPLARKESSPAPLGRNRTHCGLRLPACLAPCGKRAAPLVTLAALPQCGHSGSLPPAHALPRLGSVLPLLRCDPCSLLCVYICKLFTFISVNFTFVNSSHL